MMAEFYEMGNGNLIAVAGRGTKKKHIIKLQQKQWVMKQGGICGIRQLTEPRAIYFATKHRFI